MFGNPVLGLIRPPDAPFILGSFRVTAAFGAIDAFHPANNPDGSHGHQGVDIGNGRQGDPILAVADGKVAFSDLIGAAKVVRIDHAGGYQSGYAHLATIETKKGLTVRRGDRIGTLGSTGATAAHLHWGTKLNGVEIDGWPLLDQNITQEADLDSSFAPKPNKTVTVTKGARHRTAPTLDAATIAIASDPGGPLGFPLLGTVVGAVVSGNSIWYAYWRPETSKVYYLHTSTCGPETPWEQSGHSDAELLAARNDAAQDAAIAVSSAAALKAAQFGTKKT